MEQHVKILGVLHIIHGAFGVLGAIAVFAVFGSVAGLMSLNPEAGSDLAFASPLVGLVGTGITIFILIMSLPGIIVGIGLIRFRPWARIAGIVISALSLVSVPFGTIIGAYGLWVLLQAQTESLFRAGANLPPQAYAPQPPVR